MTGCLNSSRQERRAARTADCVTTAAPPHSEISSSCTAKSQMWYGVMSRNIACFLF